MHILASSPGSPWFERERDLELKHKKKKNEADPLVPIRVGHVKA